MTLLVGVGKMWVEKGQYRGMTSPLRPENKQTLFSSTFPLQNRFQTHVQTFETMRQCANGNKLYPCFRIRPNGF